MQFGLPGNIIERIQKAFESNAKVDAVIIFGSRAKGNYKEGSDIDLAVKGRNISFNDIQKLSGQLEELNLPYKIDIIDYASINDKDVVEHIDRVGIVFYERWKKYKLGELCTDINYGYTASASDKPIGPKFLRITDIVPQRVNWETVPFCEIKQTDFEKTKLEKGDIVIARTGATTGYNYMFNDDVEAVFASYLIRYRLNKGLAYPNFINYYLKTNGWTGFVEGIVGGSAQPGANAKMFAQFEIRLPPHTEQIQIASFLTSLDDKIDLLHRQNKTLEQLSETLFKKWFVEEAGEEWEEKKLGELLTITSSKRIFYSEYVSSGIPFYRSKEIIELRNTGSTNSELYISNERFNEIDERFGSPKEGDILMTSVGTLGVAYRVRKSDKFYFKDGNLTWFKDFKQLPSSIIYLWLISKIGQEELASISIGSTQEALTIEGLKSMSFKIPPENKVKKYAQEFDTIIKKIEFNQQQILTLTQLRDTLLPKLMSGEVRVEMN